MSNPTHEAKQAAEKYALDRQKEHGIIGGEFMEAEEGFLAGYEKGSAHAVSWLGELDKAADIIFRKDAQISKLDQSLLTARAERDTLEAKLRELGFNDVMIANTLRPAPSSNKEKP